MGILVRVVLLAATVGGAAATAAEGQAPGPSLARAQEAEARLAFSEALHTYEALALNHPSSVEAPLARARAATLRAHGEGDFLPLAALEEARRAPHFHDDIDGATALASRADTFPAGPVRGEARLLAADVFLTKGHGHSASTLLRRVADDTAAEDLTARQAATLLVRQSVERGDISEALRDAAPRRTLVEPHLLAKVERLARRRNVRGGALALVALAVAATSLAFLRSSSDVRRRLKTEVRRTLPLVIAFAGTLALGGGLAKAYQPAAGIPFIALGVVIVPLLLLARGWAMMGAPQASHRWARSLTCGAAVFAVTFLLLEGLQPAYLEGFGL